jgi:hypothetical protein
MPPRAAVAALLSTVLVALLAVVTAAPAFAHTRLVSSTPVAGTPAEAPAEVVLVFSDPVQPGLSAVSVTGSDGEEHVAGSPAAGGDGATVTQPLRAPLEAGTYRVAYRVLAADGHPVTGTFDVVATAAPTAAPATSGPPTAAPEPTTEPTPEPTTRALRPAADEQEDDGGLPVLPLVVGGLVVAAVAGLLARRLGGAAPGA